MRSFKRARARSVQHTRSTEEIARTYTSPFLTYESSVDASLTGEKDVIAWAMEALTAQVGAAFLLLFTGSFDGRSWIEKGLKQVRLVIRRKCTVQPLLEHIRIRTRFQPSESLSRTSHSTRHKRAHNGFT